MRTGNYVPREVVKRSLNIEEARKGGKAIGCKDFVKLSW